MIVKLFLIERQIYSFIYNVVRDFDEYQKVTDEPMNILFNLTMLSY